MIWKLAQFDSEARVVSAERASVFIILVGGPGLYQGKDPAHDKSWYSYIDPVIRANDRGVLGQKNEDVRWCVYAPAYTARWSDDRNEPSWWEDNVQDSDLSVTRYRHTEKIVRENATNYLDYITLKASQSNKSNSYTTRVVPINSSAEFWRQLTILAIHSLGRVWFLGHASIDLWLTLYHDGARAVMRSDKTSTETVQVSDIAAYAALRDRFMSKPLPSKFYGCNTYKFAETWAKEFGVPAEGAEGKVDFQASGFAGVESSATVWRRY